MRLSVKSLFGVLALSLAASAARATTIDFSVGGTGNGSYTSSAPGGITSSTTAPTAFRSYTEFGFTVGSVSGLVFNPNQLVPESPSLTGGTPATGTNTGSLTITAGSCEPGQLPTG